MNREVVCVRLKPINLYIHESDLTLNVVPGVSTFTL